MVPPFCSRSAVSRMKSEASLARTKSHGGNVYYYQEPSTETIKVFCLLLYFRHFLYRGTSGGLKASK